MQYKDAALAAEIENFAEVLPHPLVIQDGYGAPPDGPGWGTELDDAVLAQHPPAAFTPVASEPYRDF